MTIRRRSQTLASVCSAVFVFLRRFPRNRSISRIPPLASSVTLVDGPVRDKDIAKMLIYFCRITENETEVSFFNREAYEAFKAHPEVSSSDSCNTASAQYYSRLNGTNPV